MIRYLYSMSREWRILTLIATFVLWNTYEAWHITGLSPESPDRVIGKQYGGSYGISLRKMPTANLVIAATQAEDYSWTSRLTLPAKVIPYIAE